MAGLVPVAGPAQRPDGGDVLAAARAIDLGGAAAR
jgi:hypothetical protein